MTDEQQNQLFEAMQGAVDKYKEVGEAFENKSGEDEIISKIEDFFNSFNQLQQVYSSIANGDEVEEVEKSNESVWSGLFSAMDKFN